MIYKNIYSCFIRIYTHVLTEYILMFYKNIYSCFIRIYTHGL